MALRKSIYTTTGVDTTYHRINGIHDYSKNEIPVAHIEVESYVSETAKNNGFVPMETNQYEFAGEDYPFNMDVVAKDNAYNALKKIEKFNNSVDC